MPLPAQLYAIPEVDRPKRKLSAVERKQTAQIGREKELRLKRKIDQCDRVLTKGEARIAAFARQIKELQKRKTALEARLARIEDRCLEEMVQARLEKVCGIRITLTARPAPAALIVDDESKLPREYVVEKLISQPDKVAIKAALAKGVEFPEGACHLVQTVSLIRK